jgi:hypothetical protein
VTQAEQPAVEDPKESGEDPGHEPERKSAIVTVSRRSRVGTVLGLTPEELKRRGDAADAIMRDYKRTLDWQRRK